MKLLHEHGTLIWRWAFSVMGVILVTVSTGIAKDKDRGPEPEWNCPDQEATCMYFTGWPLGANYIGSDALGKAWGTGYTVEPVDDDGWYPTEFLLKHPHGTLQPTSIGCSIDTTKNGQSEIKIPQGTTHCGVIYQDEENYIAVLFASNPLGQCLGWGECVRPNYTPPALSRGQGPVGMPFTIDDPQKRIQSGDVAVFYPLGGNPLAGAPATDIVITADGASLTALVPNVPTDMQYHVAVVNLSTGEIRFEQLGFYVTLS